MKKLVLALALALPLSTLSLGCAAKQTVSAPLPSGAIDNFDAVSYRVLSDSHAAIESVSDDVRSGKIALTDSQKLVLNQFIADQNLANNVYKSYHAGASNDASALSVAVAKVVTDLSNLAIALGGKK